MLLGRMRKGGGEGVSELYVAGNSLGGPLPPYKTCNQLVTLYANQQHDVEFTGEW